MLICLGHIPTVAGESVRADRWDLAVGGVDHHAITEVRVRRRPHRHQPDGAEDVDGADAPALDRARG